MPVRIKDWIIPYTWWQWIEITDNHVINVLLREMNNLIHVNGDRELYVDLQLPSGIKPTDTFPVGVTTGKILQADWWQQSWIILNWKTTSWDYNRLIYANDGKLYYDKGDWVWVELWWWHMAYFKTPSEYADLPSSKNSDNNLYIIVDSHPFIFMPFSELIQLSQPNGILDELNRYPQWYADYYYNNGDINKTGDRFRFLVTYNYNFVEWTSQRYADAPM